MSEDAPVVENVGPLPETTPPAPARSAYDQLTGQQRRFVDAWLSGMSGKDAAIAAGSKAKNPEEWACRTLKKPLVRTAWMERDAEAAERAGITHTMIYTHLKHVATFDHRKLYDPATGEPLPIHQLPAEVAAGLAGTEVEEIFEGQGKHRRHTGRIHKYRSWPKTDALRTLAQIKRMMPQQHEVSGPNGGAIPQVVLNTNVPADPVEAARFYREMIQTGGK